MKRPPCKTPDGVDCPKRYIGCQSECETYHDWLAVHAAEKEKMRRKKCVEINTTSFIIGREKRKRLACQSKYDKERRNWG